MSIRPHLSTAEKCLREGEVGLAAAHLRGAQELAPQSLRLSYSAALLESLSGKAGAYTEVEQTCARMPGLLPVISLQGLSDQLIRLGREVPTNLTLRLAVSEALAQDGRAAEARDMFIEIIREHRAGRDYPHLPIQGLGERVVRTMVAGQPIWHSIDLGEGLWIEGARKTARITARELLQFDFPPLAGKTVLDIGAFGGFFSFEAERRGASAVTALEYYSWITDFPKMHKWIDAERAAGREPNAYAPPQEALDIVEQPGRRAFDITRFVLGSKIRPVCALLETADLETHDIVFYLGVLYHSIDPFGALRAVSSVTREIAVIETLAVHVPGHETRPLWEFYGDSRVNNDATTWWAPNETALKDILIASGFSRVETKVGADAIVEHNDKPALYRLIVHAFK